MTSTLFVMRVDVSAIDDEIGAVCGTRDIMADAGPFHDSDSALAYLDHEVIADPVALIVDRGSTRELLVGWRDRRAAPPDTGLLAWMRRLLRRKP